jgi:hypothetical protein
MERKQRKAELIAVDLGETVQNTNASLRDEVKQALRAVLRDKDASAAAKASAGRTLLEYFSDSESAHLNARRGADMSAAELDAMIARLDV